MSFMLKWFDFCGLMVCTEECTNKVDECFESFDSCGDTFCENQYRWCCDTCLFGTS